MAIDSGIFYNESRKLSKKRIVCQYTISQMMVARHCGMVPGELLHVIADAHSYDRH